MVRRLSYCPQNRADFFDLPRIIGVIGVNPPKPRPRKNGDVSLLCYVCQTKVVSVQIPGIDLRSRTALAYISRSQSSPSWPPQQAGVLA
jgi:hypothetical protein